jgi:hypothetical protein
MYIITAWQHIPPGVYRVFRSVVYPIQWMRLIMICGMAVKRRE